MRRKDSSTKSTPFFGFYPAPGGVSHNHDVRLGFGLVVMMARRRHEVDVVGGGAGGAPSRGIWPGDGPA
jgi:hypothetical protein